MANIELHRLRLEKRVRLIMLHFIFTGLTLPEN